VKDSFEHSIKESLENFEMPYNADAWKSMSDKLDARSSAGKTAGAESVATGAGLGAAAGGLTDTVKHALEGFEAPYNPAAWETMQTRLNKEMPVKGGKSSLKWYLGAAAVAGLLVATYFMTQDDQPGPVQTADVTSELTESNNQTNISNTSDKTIHTTDNQNIDPDTGSNINNIDESAGNPAVNNNGGNESSSNSSNEEVGNLATHDNGHQPSHQPNDAQPVDNNTNINEPTSGLSGNEAENVALILPSVADICEGESFEIENVNDVPLLITGPELHFMVPAKQNRIIRTKRSGLHIVSGMNEHSDSQVEFHVNDSPQADFLIDPSIKFESGLPTTKVASTVPGTRFEWIFNNQKVSGQKADAHFYTKGEHLVTLTVTGSNGCKNSISKPVFVDENYNLMAMNSFRPNSTDPTTNTFMPYALKERDVHFTMIIIDPTDGRVIYETSDASHGWDGVDATTGRLVPFETSYIWKVTIDNTATNEVRNEYSGHVIPVRTSN